MTADLVFDLIRSKMLLTETKPSSETLLKVIKKSQRQQRQEAYEKALQEVMMTFQERQKRDEALLKKIFFAQELLKT